MAKGYLDVAGEESQQRPSQEIADAPGPVSRIARHYVSARAARAPHLPGRLLGFLLNLSYEDVSIVTCDPWKRGCGGVPRSSFVLVRLSPQKVSAEEASACDRLVMVRVTESVPTPVASEMQQTVFQIHKAQADLDPITHKDFQWSGLRGTVVGTFYDKPAADGGTPTIGFGLDVDTFFSAHCYEVYVPTSQHLEQLINAFGDALKPLDIGKLRYTETPSYSECGSVTVKVDPSDFVGKSYGHRTALFGKTRFGKSNTMKVVADTVLRHDAAGQIVFDPSGEYTYWNEQDGGCLAARYPGACVRYSLKPRELKIEKEFGLTIPRMLLVDFYRNPDVGHSLAFSLWTGSGERIPDYYLQASQWEPKPLSACPDSNNRSGFNHYWRTMGIWYAILREAGFTAPDINVPIDLPKDVKEQLLKDSDFGSHLRTFHKAGKQEPQFSTQQPAHLFAVIWKKVASIYATSPNLFPPGSLGDPYFDATELGMLGILSGNMGSGALKLARFREYHDIRGSDVFSAIVEQAQAGKTVFVDLSMGGERVRKAIAERISIRLLQSQMTLFNTNSMGDRFVVLYFEEAHNLFPKSDKDVGSDVYNKLAKEGAKFNISMVYATQSMSTLSPDLLKNTENFIVTHLDDDREVKELEHKRAFRDMAANVERITSKGYVLMKTLSLPFALPVQIRKFEGRPDGPRLVSDRG